MVFNSPRLWGSLWWTRNVNILKNYQWDLSQEIGKSMQDLLEFILWSLSYWNINLLHKFSFLSNEIKFSINIYWYFDPFMFPSMACNATVPFAEKQPQIMMLLPPYVTLGFVLLGSYTQPFCLQTSRQAELFPKSYIFLTD